MRGDFNVFITDKELLKDYATDHRVWQGIPGIEVTKRGRIYSTFYSGQKGETLENYVVLVRSDDGGKSFSEPIAVAYIKKHRCFDPCLWIDPLGRMWLFWAIQPDSAVYGVYCENPDDDNLVWSDVRHIGYDVMMNKPVVLSTGEWILPISVWQRGNLTICDFMDSKQTEGAFVYKSTDNGETFVKMGAALIPPIDAAFHEHMVIELNDGRLMMLLRTLYGIGVSYSWDRGKTWTEVKDSGIGGPCSRFCIRRLKSGKILLINHYEFNGRNNLTALLSDDEGKTWKWKLLLDERSDVSYPDVAEHDGNIYVIYDRERGDDLKSIDEVYNKGREIIFAKITEEDIIAQKIVSKESKLKCIVSKLGKFYDESYSPYGRFFALEEATCILTQSGSKEKALKRLFELYPLKCLSMKKCDAEKLDTLIEIFKTSDEEESFKRILGDIVEFIYSVKEENVEEQHFIEKITKSVKENLINDVLVEEFADMVGMSHNYMSYIFKKVTGIAIDEYKEELKLVMAKKMLLSTGNNISDIAYSCGFKSENCFTKRFEKAEGMTVERYRKLHSK